MERLAEANHAIARCGVGAVTGPHGLEDCPYRHLFDRNAEAIAREYDRLGSET